MYIVVEIFYVIKNVIQAVILSIVRFFIPPERKSVKYDIVLITGAARGVGRQLAVEFSKLGAVVVLWDIDEKENEETARKIKELGGRCHTYKCDVSDKEQVFTTGRKVKSEVGDVSILINNAGIVNGKKLLAIPDHMIEKTFNVNLLGQFWTVKCFLPSMLRNNHGHIVNISSSAGIIGLNKLTDYSATKFGVLGFTEVLNYEVVYSGYSGVYTTVVCPSFIETGMFEGCKMRFLPVNAMLEIHKFFGGDDFMDSYVGREEVQADTGLKGVDDNNETVNGHTIDKQ